MRLAPDAVIAWKQRLSVKTVTARDADGNVAETTSERIDAISCLTAVRAFYLDIAQWALDMDNSGPVKIEPPDGKATSGLKFTYANGIEMFHGGSVDCLFEGRDGKVFATRDGLRTEPAAIRDQPLGDEAGQHRATGSAEAKDQPIKATNTQTQAQTASDEFGPVDRMWRKGDTDCTVRDHEADGRSLKHSVRRLRPQFGNARVVRPAAPGE